MSTENSAQILIDLQRKVNELAALMRTPAVSLEQLHVCDQILGIGLRLHAKLMEERAAARRPGVAE